MNDVLALFWKGVKIPVGQSKTIELDLFSDGDTGGPWLVDVKDYSAQQPGQPLAAELYVRLAERPERPEAPPHHPRQRAREPLRNLSDRVVACKHHELVVRRRRKRKLSASAVTYGAPSDFLGLAMT
jgi:hypothetical protein